MYMKSLALIFLIALMLGTLTAPFSPKVSSAHALALTDDQQEPKDQLTKAATELTKVKSAISKLEDGATPKQKTALQSIEKAVGDVVDIITNVVELEVITKTNINDIIGKLNLLRIAFELGASALNNAKGLDALKTLKEAIQNIVNIVNGLIQLLKDLWDALKEFLNFIGDKISSEGGNASDNTQKPVFNNTRDNLSGFTTISYLPSELGGGSVTSDVIGGSFTITSYSTADPNVSNVSIASMNIVFDSVTLLGISTGPNHCINDPKQPRFTLLNTTGGIWQANLTINGFVTNDIYTSANPIRYFGVAQGTYDSTTNILNLSISAFDFIPPIVPTTLTVFVGKPNPSNPPLPGASVSVWNTTDRTLVYTGTTDGNGKVTFTIPRDVYLVTVTANGYLSTSSVFLLEGNILTGNMYWKTTLYPPGWGGASVPVDEFALLARYIGLASTITIAAVASIILAKRRKKKQ
jgi:hypothetical protein